MALLRVGLRPLLRQLQRGILVILPLLMMPCLLNPFKSGRTEVTFPPSFSHDCLWEMGASSAAIYRESSAEIRE